MSYKDCIRIAIDPDINKCGVATMINGKLTSLESMDFIEVLAGIQGNFKYRLEQTMGGDLVNNVYYCIEHVELIKTVWDRPVFDKFGKIKIVQNQAVKIKIAQNVGMVKAAGRIIGQQFERCEIEFELIPPLKGFLKRGKKDAKFFNKLMGWSGKSNADNRDAALLLYPYLKKG